MYICILYIIVLILIYDTNLIYYYVHVWSCCKLVRQLQQEDEVSEKAWWGMKGSQFRFTCCRSSSTEGLYSLCMSFVYWMLGYLNMYANMIMQSAASRNQPLLCHGSFTRPKISKDSCLIHGTDTFSIVNIENTWSFMCPSMFETSTRMQYVNIIKERPCPPC